MALVNEKAFILQNVCVGSGLYLMSLMAPCIARDVMGGQFVHMKLPHDDTHLLRRPFSIYARDASEGTIDILYQVVGYGTEHMTALATNDEVEIIGAIGRCWQPPSALNRALLVGGGIGAAPLFMLCGSLIDARIDVDVILGAQSFDTLVCRERYTELLGKEPSCSTDDGSYGTRGFCTTLVERSLKDASLHNFAYDYIAACGPEPFMRIVSNLAEQYDVYCEVSMERRMACGIGACLSCVVDTHEGRKRVCVDGPVFDAKEIIW